MKASIVAAIASVAAVQAGHCEEDHASCLLSLELPNLLNLDLLCQSKYEECCDKDHDDEPSVPGVPGATTSTYTTTEPIVISTCPPEVYDCPYTTEPTTTETEYETTSICSVTKPGKPVEVTTTSTITVSGCPTEVPDCPYSNKPTMVTSTFITHAPPPSTMESVHVPAETVPAVPEVPAVYAPEVPAHEVPAVPAHEIPAESHTTPCPPAGTGMYPIPGAEVPGHYGTAAPSASGVAIPTNVPGAGSEVPISHNAASSVQAGSLAAFLVMAAAAMMM